MKEDWKYDKLKNVCTIRPPKKEAKESLKDDELVSFIPMDKLGINQMYFGSDDSRTLKSVYSGYTYFKEGDVILAKITPCFENGKLGIAKGLDNGVGFGSSEYVVYRPIESLHNKFLYYFLSNSSFREKGQNLMGGAVGHQRIPKEFYEEEKIPIPPLEEQKQIVVVLDKAFAAIDQAKANLEKNIENAKELFQSKLNEIFSHPSTNSGQEGDGWEEKTLGEVCSLYQGLAINKKTKHLLVEKSPLPLLRIKDLRNNSHEQYVAESGFPINALVKEDQIIYTRTGNSLGLVFRGRTGVLHNNSFKIIPHQSISNDYLFWWLQHEAFTSKIIALASKAAQPDISHKLFKEEPISIPSIEQQANYYSIISVLDKSTKELVLKYKTKRDDLEELKKSILQKAFAGELSEPMMLND